MTLHANDEPLLLTVRQAAKLLQMSVNSVYNLIAQNLIPHVRFGKLIRIPRWALLQYIASASGSPIPMNFDVATPAIASVHGQKPQEG